MSTGDQDDRVQAMAQWLVLTLVEYPTVMVAGEVQPLTGEIANISDANLTLVTYGDGFVWGRLWDEGASMPVGGESDMWVGASAGIKHLAPGATLRMGGRIRACISPPSEPRRDPRSPLEPLPPGLYQARASVWLQVTDDPIGLDPGALVDPTIWWRDGLVLSPFYRVAVTPAT